MNQWVRIDFIIRGAGSVHRCRDDQVPTHDPAATVIHEDLCRYELHQAKDWLHGRPISELPELPESVRPAIALQPRSKVMNRDYEIMLKLVANAKAYKLKPAYQTFVYTPR